MSPDVKQKRRHHPDTQMLADIKSVAVVGVSQKKTKFGSSAYRELKQRGYRVYPVHPTLETIDDERCYRSVADLPETPDCVLVTVNPAAAVDVVEQAAARQVRTVWFQQGADFSEAVARAEQAGMRIASGRCILMYAEPVGGLHRFHRGLSKLFGKY